MNKRNALTAIALAMVLSGCGGGGSTKPDSGGGNDIACGQRIGSAPFVNSVSNGPTVNDTTCPAGQTAVQAGISYQRTTTTYSCNNPSSTSEQPRATSSVETITTQSKICQVTVAARCAGIADPRDQYACRTGFTATQAAGLTGDGIAMGAIEPGITLNSPGINGKPVEVFGGNDSANGGHGSAVANILMGDKNVASSAGGQANANTGGLLPDLDKLVVSPGISSPILSNFSTQGVRVINWSGATDAVYGDAGASTTAAGFLPFWRDATARGLLLVMSAGNTAKTQPAITASLPNFDAGVLNSTLTVVSADPYSLTGNPSSAVLASYSNWCGVAKDYCLTAPGTVWVPSVSGGTQFAGTSAAAPIVSAAAALTWAQLPFLDAWQLRESLLTTATDLGAAGVDDRFGHGLVNVEKSIQGPGELRDDWSVNINVPGVYTFGNDIGGVGGLEKLGSGILRLTGDNRFTGGILVGGGELRLAGSTNTSAANVASGGTLSGNGSVGALGNSGLVAVEGGDLVVNGNYTQNASGDLSVAVGETLLVNGQANLAGDFSLKVPDSYVVSGAIAPAVSASAGLNGTFATTASSSPLFVLSTSYTLNDVNVALTRISAAGLLSTSSVNDGGERLDDMFNVIDEIVLAGGSSDAVQSAAMIQGVDSIEALEVAVSTLSGNVYADNLSQMRNNNRASVRNAITMTGQSTHGGLMAGVVDGGNGGFGHQVGVGFGDDGVKTGVLVQDLNQTGWNAGQSSMLESTGGRIDIAAVRDAGDSWTLAAVLSHSVWDTEVNRRLVFGQNGFDVNGVQSGHISSVTLDASRKVGKATVSVGLNGGEIGLNGVRESGQSGLELDMNGSNKAYANATVGLAAANTWNGGNSTWTLAGGVYADYLLAGDDVLRASYAGIDGFGFDVNGGGDRLRSWGDVSLNGQRGHQRFSFGAQVFDDGQVSANASWMVGF